MVSEHYKQRLLAPEPQKHRAAAAKAAVVTAGRSVDDHGLLEQIAHGVGGLGAESQPLLNGGGVQVGLLPDWVVPPKVLRHVAHTPSASVLSSHRASHQYLRCAWLQPATGWVHCPYAIPQGLS